MTPNLAIVLTALVLLLLERIPAIRRIELRVLRPQFGGDLLFLLVGFVAGSKLALQYVGFASDAIGTSWSTSFWISVPIAIVLLDLGNYLCHAALHRFEPMWKLHQVHHSIRDLDWLTTFRSHPLEQLFRRLAAPLFLIAAGIPLDTIAVAAAFLIAWATFIHSNLSLDLRFLEPLLITPRLHHLHHLVDSSDRNLGIVFSVWDRLLGRLTLEPAKKGAATGVPGELDSYPQGFVAQLLEPFRR